MSLLEPKEAETKLCPWKYGNNDSNFRCSSFECMAWLFCQEEYAPIGSPKKGLCLLVYPNGLR